MHGRKHCLGLGAPDPGVGGESPPHLDRGSAASIPPCGNRTKAADAQASADPIAGGRKEHYIISPVQIWGPEAALIYSTGAYGITPAGPPRREEAIGHCGWHWPQYPAWVIACLLWVPRSRQSIGSGRSLRVVGLVIYALKVVTDRECGQQLPPERGPGLPPKGEP